MVFVKRNDSGQVISVMKTEDSDHSEQLEQTDPQLIAYLIDRLADKDTLEQQLSGSDLKMIRVIDDIINLLIEKRIICFTELPEAAQEKIIQRRNLRQKLLGLISDEDDMLSF